MFFESKISFKIGSMFALITMLAFLSLVVGTIEVRQTNSEFENLINREIEGSVWLSRASRRVLQIGYESYSAISTDPSSAAFTKASNAA